MSVSILWLDSEYPSPGAQFLREQGFQVSENISLDLVQHSPGFVCALVDRYFPDFDFALELLAARSVPVVVMASVAQTESLHPDELLGYQWPIVQFVVKVAPWQGLLPVVTLATAQGYAHQRAYHRLLLHSRGFAWSTNAQEVFISVSPEVTALLGYLPEEMIGQMRLRDLRQPGLDSHYKPGFFRALDAGRDIVDTINPLRHRDGHTVWVRTNADIQRSSQGQRIGYNGHDLDACDLTAAVQKQAQEHCQLQALLESMADWVVVLRRDMKFVEAFLPTKADFPFSRSDIVGERLADLCLPPSVLREIVAKLQICFADERSVRFSFELRVPETVSFFEVSASPIRCAEGPPEEVVCVVRDVSCSRRTEQDLQEQRDMLAAVIDSIDDIVAIQNPDLTIERYNRAGLELLGVSADEAVGKLCYHLIGKDAPCDHCTSLTAVQERTAQVSERLLPDEQRLLLAKSIPICDEQGEVVRVIEHLKDITASRQLEDQLRSDLDRIYNAFHSMVQYVVVINEQGTVQFMNRSAVDCFGDQTGCSWPPVPRQSRQSSSRPDLQAFRISWQDRLLEGTITPIDDHQGHRGSLEVLYDVTERETAAAKLRYLTYYDPVTGVHNRRFFDETLQTIDTAEHWPLAIIMVDVNGLKLTNDAFGHGQGDRLLRLTAEQLQANCDREGIVCRIGGDEFVLLLPHTNETQAAEMETRIQQAISGQQLGSIPLSAATGRAVKTSPSQPLSQLLKTAEDQMYRDKLSERHSLRHASIELITTTLYEKRPSEEAHSRRVSDMAVHIGEALGMGSLERDELFLAAILHDIGKIAVPIEILEEKADLTTEQWEQIRRHPEIGYNILSSVNDYARIGNYVLAHHECWDGTGYPHGVVGKDIPLPARIIAVADAWDTMTNTWPYRKALGPAEILHELRLGRGSKWDPRVIDALLQLKEKELLAALR